MGNARNPPVSPLAPRKRQTGVLSAPVELETGVVGQEPQKEPSHAVSGVNSRLRRGDGTGLASVPAFSGDFLPGVALRIAADELQARKETRRRTWGKSNFGVPHSRSVESRENDNTGAGTDRVPRASQLARGSTRHGKAG